MKALEVSRYWAIGATVVFGLAQVWAAYHLSARLHSQPGEGARWLLIGAVILMVSAEVLTTVSATRDR